MLSPVIYEYEAYGDERTGVKAKDIYFDADIQRTYRSMQSRRVHQHKASGLHPLSPLLTYTPARVLRALGRTPVQAAWGVMSLVCGAWTFLMFRVLTIWGLRVGDAIVFTVLAEVSATAIFWFAVPDLFPFGSVTILLALLLTMWPPRLHKLVRYTLVFVSSISTAVTNVMVAFIAALLRLNVREIWVAGVSAWFIVCMIWGIQKLLFPEALFFLVPKGSWDDGSGFIATWTFAPTAERVLESLRVLLLHSIVMPDIRVLSGANVPALFADGATQMMTIQKSSVGSSGVMGIIATLAWSALSTLGAWSLWTKRTAFGTLCAAVLVAQCAFHLVFGWEVFLYAMHVLPMLIVMAAAVTFTRFRPAGLALAGALIVSGGISNWIQFEHAAEIVRQFDEHARSVTGGHAR